MTDLPEPQVFDGVVLNKSGLYTATVNGYTADQMREYRNQALEEAIAKVHIAMLGEDRQLTVRVLTALIALKEQK